MCAGCSSPTATRCACRRRGWPAILDALNDAFPRLQRVGIYANARDVLGKSDEELADLRRRGLKILYTGLESGDDDTLAAVEKGATAAEIVEAVRRARAAGIATSVMVLVGLAGVERSLEHARRSAEAINAMAPNYTALLTYTPTPHSPLAARVARGEVVLPSPRESIAEIREFVGAVDVRDVLHLQPRQQLPAAHRPPAAGEGGHPRGAGRRARGGCAAEAGVSCAGCRARPVAGSETPLDWLGSQNLRRRDGNRRNPEAIARRPWHPPCRTTMYHEGRWRECRRSIVRRRTRTW